MSSKNKATTSRRRALMGVAGLAASGATVNMAWGAEKRPFVIKKASLLQRKPGITHEEFAKHWAEIHAPMAIGIPGIGRYALTIINKTSARKNMPTYDGLQVDGIAEQWFRSQADYEAYLNSPKTARLRDDGATFIGRQIDFLCEEKVIIST
jgi:uncharacterized protein (TIGR02118 family)